jgi:hypothetical protein
MNCPTLPSSIWEINGRVASVICPMSAPSEDRKPVYDRALLLHGTKRDEVLTLEEVRQYGMFAGTMRLRRFGGQPSTSVEAFELKQSGGIPLKENFA